MAEDKRGNISLFAKPCGQPYGDTMYSFSNFASPDTTGLPRYPHFADIHEAIKGHPSMRMMLDGQAGFSRLDPVQQYEHQAKCMFWDFLQRTNPHEYKRQGTREEKLPTAPCLPQGA